MSLVNVKPIHEIMGSKPSILDKDLENVWNVVNWVYKIRERHPRLVAAKLGNVESAIDALGKTGKMPERGTEVGTEGKSEASKARADSLLPPRPAVKRARTLIVKQTAGFLLLGLTILTEEAQPKFWPSSLGAEGLSDAEKKEWASVFIEAERRLHFITSFQEFTIDSVFSYKPPRLISMVHASCSEAMKDLRASEAAVGCNFAKGLGETLALYITWWRFLEYAVRRDEKGEDIIRPKTCLKNIEYLQQLIVAAQ